jgi:ABC-type phosphate transport system ATPase subunit
MAGSAWKRCDPLLHADLWGLAHNGIIPVMKLAFPELALVVLIGPSGSGKSTFAKAHFLPTEIVSSDACRGIVSDDENDQSATEEAFDLLHYIVRLPPGGSP